MSEFALAIGIHGAAGRMGTRLIQLIAADPTLKLSAALEHANHLRLGEDPAIHAGIKPSGLVLSVLEDLKIPIDVMIDFSHSEGSLLVAVACRMRKIPLVVGTTGFDPKTRGAVAASAVEIPLLMAPNMSRAVNLLERLVGEAARLLGSEADIEIIERHHRLKKDSPSGTALRLAEVAGKAIGSSNFIYGRYGQTGERTSGEIGIHAIRTGDNPGEHTVVFGLLGETLEITHRAINRDGFARGALDAAKFLASQPPGLYSMEDVLC